MLALLDLFREESLSHVCRINRGTGAARGVRFPTAVCSEQLFFLLGRKQTFAWWRESVETDIIRSVLSDTLKLGAAELRPAR